MTADDETQHLSKEDNRMQTLSLKMCRMQLKISYKQFGKHNQNKNQSMKIDTMIIQILKLPHKNIFVKKIWEILKT